MSFSGLSLVGDLFELSSILSKNLWFEGSMLMYGSFENDFWC